MYIRKIAAAAGFACGAALAFAPVSAADTASAAAADFWPGIDGILSGLPAATTTVPNLAISFDGISLLQSGTAHATTLTNQFGFAIASGDHATAYAAGGYGDSASAFGSYALADAGSKAANAAGFNFNSATDFGNNVDPSTYAGAPDGAYAGGASLIGGTDAATASSNNTAQFIGNAGVSGTVAPTGGNSGAFAGDSGLIGAGHVAGSGDTAYTSGNILGANDGSAAVGGNSNSAFTNGTETGNNEGAFAGLGSYNSATADTNYTTSGSGVSAIGGNYNYASVYGPNNSTADAGGTSSLIGQADHVGNGNVAIVSDPFGSTADSANAGSSATTSGNSDLAEVLFTHGTASATGGSNLYDIITPFGTSATPATAEAVAAAAADPASTTPVSISTTVASEISSLNSMFVFDANLFGVGNDLIAPTTTQPFETISLVGAPDTAPFNAFDYFLYGLDPANNVSSDPGAYDLLNGSEIRFDEATNIATYAFLNGGALDPNSADYFNAALPVADTTAPLAFTTFFNDAIGDLSGYFQTNLTFLDITPASATELFTFLGSL